MAQLVAIRSVLHDPSGRNARTIPDNGEMDNNFLLQWQLAMNRYMKNSEHRE